MALNQSDEFARPLFVRPKIQNLFRLQTNQQIFTLVKLEQEKFGIYCLKKQPQKIHWLSKKLAINYLSTDKTSKRPIVVLL